MQISFVISWRRFFLVWISIDSFAVFEHFMQRGARIWIHFTLRSLLLLNCIAVVRQLFDVVHQAVQLPLPIDFGFAAQRKTVQALVAA